MKAISGRFQGQLEVTQLKAQGSSRTCNESKEEEGDLARGVGTAAVGEAGSAVGLREMLLEVVEVPETGGCSARGACSLRSRIRGLRVRVQGVGCGVSLGSGPGADDVEDERVEHLPQRERVIY